MYIVLNKRPLATLHSQIIRSTQSSNSVLLLEEKIWLKNVSHDFGALILLKVIQSSIKIFQCMGTEKNRI